MEAHQLIYQADALPERVTPRAEAIARRGLDLFVGTLGLVLLIPVVLVIVAAIRIESGGPVLFRQRRLGRGMSPFTLNKFRTMHADCDQALHRTYVQALIRDYDNAPTHRDGLYKLSGDERVTRVGAFLRRWSLDELPQIWNVLRGEMSLTGPRPVIAYEAEAYPDWYRERFAVKPGMTGLWQVSGRNERTYDEMVRLDIDYVRRQSVLLDLTILVRTLWVVLRRKGVA